MSTGGIRNPVLFLLYDTENRVLGKMELRGSLARLVLSEWEHGLPEHTLLSLAGALAWGALTLSHLHLMPTLGSFRMWLPFRTRSLPGSIYLSVNQLTAWNLVGRYLSACLSRSYNIQLHCV